MMYCFSNVARNSLVCEKKFNKLLPGLFVVTVVNEKENFRNYWDFLGG